MILIEDYFLFMLTPKMANIVVLHTFIQRNEGDSGGEFLH